MRALIIKMSSMGDVIHTLPALSDASQILPSISFDWVVEKDFEAIPRLHPAVGEVIPIELRRWRKNWLQAFRSQAPQTFVKQLQGQTYDMVIDAQGLLKSGLVTCLAKGTKHGLNKQSARESVASYFYERRHAIAKNMHAVERTRQLFAKALGYTPPSSEVNYGLTAQAALTQPHVLARPYLVFLHNTTWVTKLWPESHWQALGKLANEQGYQVVLTSGNEQEFARAKRIEHHLNDARALPRQSIGEMITWLRQASGIVSVDTGFAHLAAALAKPNVCLFGATDPALSRPYGPCQTLIQSTLDCSPCLKKQCKHQEANKIAAVNPCLDEIKPAQVWQLLQTKLAQ